MASKKAVLDVANDSLDTLKAHLNKLKREEAKLEIALTLRDFPTVEDELVRLTTCVVELNSVERCMRLESTQSSADEIKNKQLQVQAQIDALKARIVVLPDNEHGVKLKEYYSKRVQELEVTKASAGMTKKNLKYLEHYEDMLRQLQSLFSKLDVEKKFPESFDVFFHVENLKKYLEIANDLIARKG